MQAEFVEFNAEKNQLTIRFPLLESYLNPFNYVQGGFLAAAVDNTLGPLSVLVAPANLTRRLEMTYSHPVTLEVGSISVIGRLVRQEGRQLHFAADVLDGQGNRLARARAWHWII
jgi:acyl-coenzyme A thioesterase PaaI-like protein